MLKNTARLFAGYDAGHYTLPERLVNLRDALTRLAAMPQLVEPPHPDTVWPELVRQAAAEFAAGKPVLDPSKRMASARAAVVAYQEQGQIRAEVERTLTEALDGSIRGAADEVIRDHLQPALIPVRDAMEEAAKRLPLNANTADVLAADEKAREAWLRLDKAATQYDALRTAWSLYGQQTEHDQFGEFAEFANLRDLWPTFGRQQLQESVVPWPTSSTTARLLWLAHHGARLILPTPAERDALWWSRYGADVEAHRRSWDTAQGYRSIGVA